MKTDSKDDVFPSQTEIAILANTSSEPIDDIVHWMKDLLPPSKHFGVKANPDSIRRSPRYSASDSDDDHPKISTISCNHYGCAATFADPYVVVAHNQMMHHLKCSECAHIFPTGHLLDMHIREQHDSMFMVQVERGELMYACMLKTCDIKFGTPQERKEHCIKEHSFPGKFRFFQLSNRVPCKGQPERMVEGTKNIKGKRNKPFVKKVEKPKPYESMAVDGTDVENPEATNVGNVFRNFSFGHQRTKTFQSYGNARSGKTSGKALEDLSALKNVLEKNM